jgi:hypothetical protein
MIISLALYSMTSMSSPLGNSGIDQRKILPLVSLEFRCSFSRIDISLQHSSAFVLTVDRLEN